MVNDKVPKRKLTYVSPRKSRNYSVFYSEEGGFMSTDALDQTTDKLYFLGVIDILTPYDLKKKAEHLIKGIVQDKVEKQKN